MSATSLLFRMMFGTVMVIVLGMCAAVAGVFVIEPIHFALGGVAPVIEGNPSSQVILFSSVSLIGLISVLLVWMVAAPIRRDVRQEF